MSNVVNLGGRPEKYLPDYSRQAEFLCRMGATNADLAEFFEVSASQIGQWAIRHEEFRAAIKTGKEPADDRAEASFYMRVVGFTHATQRTTREVEYYTDEESGERRSRVKKEVTVSEETYYPPEWSAAFAWLKNRRPATWRDKVELNGSMRFGVAAEASSHYSEFTQEELENMSLDELQRAYAEEIARSPGPHLLSKPDTKPN